MTFSHLIPRCRKTRIRWLSGSSIASSKLPPTCRIRWTSTPSTTNLCHLDNPWNSSSSKTYWQTQSSSSQCRQLTNPTFYLRFCVYFYFPFCFQIAKQICEGEASDPSEEHHWTARKTEEEPKPGEKMCREIEIVCGNWTQNKCYRGGKQWTK